MNLKLVIDSEVFIPSKRCVFQTIKDTRQNIALFSRAHEDA